jgi:CDP-glucose 4,6-dehydratase
VGVGQRPVEAVGVDPAFWRGRRVLVTGHTGFKGAWLTLWLREMGAAVTGLSDGVPTSPSLYELAGVGEGIVDLEVDVRDADAVDAALAANVPDVVLHLAAQSLVRRSFRDPRETYSTNVMGTVNVLEAVRRTPSVAAVVNVTSDKCYDNRGQNRPFVEDDPMGGHDPYSNSKGCAELVGDAYLRSFFSVPGSPTRLASARAGNVIGGGDWGEDRLIPDIVRGALAGEDIRIRNPTAVRPWQHVLNPLSGYLELAQALVRGDDVQGGWNFGPSPDDVRPVSWIVERLAERWPGELRAVPDPGPHPHEASFLALDSTKARTRLGWSPAWDLAATLDAIVDWYTALQAGGSMREATLGQIRSFAGSSLSGP